MTSPAIPPVAPLVDLSPVLRCATTTNPCGTDTWAVGYECPCLQCQRWLRAFKEGEAAGLERAALKIIEIQRNGSLARPYDAGLVEKIRALKGNLMLDEKTLADLRAKVEKATPGPWGANTSLHSTEFCSVMGPQWDVCLVNYDDDRRPVSSRDPELDPLRHAAEDAELIAALRNAAPDLLRYAEFGMRAKAFLEEHGDALGAGLSLMEIETIEEREARDAARDALRAFSESARALTEAKGGK